MADLPSSVTFATITGKFATTTADTAGGLESEPDLVYLSGEVWITPRVNLIVLVDDESDPISIFPAKLVATLVDGVITDPDGNDSITVISTDVGSGPWSYHIEYRFTDVPGMSFDISAPADAIIDLSTVAHVEPETLEVLAEPEPAWWSALQEVIDDLDEVAGGDLSSYALLASPAFTGNPTVPTQALGNNSTRIASTAFVKAALDALIAGAPSGLDTLLEIATMLEDEDDAVSALTAAVAGKVPMTRTISGHALSSDISLVVGDVSGAAPTASPTFTGTPSAPTATAGDNTTKISTTAFVTAAVAAILASPAFTGNPTAPTQATGNSTTRLATTAFVQQELTAFNPDHLKLDRITSAAYAALSPPDADTIYLIVG